MTHANDQNELFWYSSEDVQIQNTQHSNQTDSIANCHFRLLKNSGSFFMGGLLLIATSMDSTDQDGFAQS